MFLSMNGPKNGKLRKQTGSTRFSECQFMNHTHNHRNSNYHFHDIQNLCLFLWLEHSGLPSTLLFFFLERITKIGFEN